MSHRESRLRCSWQRVYTSPFWLISIWIGIAHTHGSGGRVTSCMPQADAVVNDFGDLVIVEMFA